jgi:hypothetical protein
MFFRLNLTPFPKIHLKLGHSINLMQNKLILGKELCCGTVMMLNAGIVK